MSIHTYVNYTHEFMSRAFLAQEGDTGTSGADIDVTCFNELRLSSDQVEGAQEAYHAQINHVLPGVGGSHWDKYEYIYIYVCTYTYIYIYVDDTLIALDLRPGEKIKENGPGEP